MGFCCVPLDWLSFFIGGRAPADRLGISRVFRYLRLIKGVFCQLEVFLVRKSKQQIIFWHINYGLKKGIILTVITVPLTYIFGVLVWKEESNSGQYYRNQKHFDGKYHGYVTFGCPQF